MAAQYKVVIDTREKLPLNFTSAEQVVKKLDTGDYSLEGYEDILSIENKSSASEVASNITEKRFWREIERLREFKYPYLLLQFTQEELAGFPWKSKLPTRIKKRIKVRGKYLISKIYEIEEMGIKVIFAGSRINAVDIMCTIFEEVLEKEKN